MKKKKDKNIKTTYLKLKLAIQCLALFSKNLLFIKSLKLKELTLYDRVVIKENEIEILWDVRGCHKIKIKGMGIFPGNIYGIKLFFTDRQNPIEITFYGIAKKLKKRLGIVATEINLLNKFIVNTSIPNTFEIPLNKFAIISEFTKLQLQINTQDIYFDIEPFNIENYKQA